MAQADARSITRRSPVAASAARLPTGSSGKISGREARFPRLRQIRTEQLGWEITDIVTRLPGQRSVVATVSLRAAVPGPELVDRGQGHPAACLFPDSLPSNGLIDLDP